MMKKIILILIAVNIFLSAYYLMMGDIHFDRDVARDFLVMDSMVENRVPTLLGPRSSIPGLFHGPLWFYVNLPAFIIGGGNPLVVGWFWFLLSITFLGIVFIVVKKLFNEQVALLTILLLSVNSIINPSVGLKNFYNPYGAVFLIPIFFWAFYKYIENQKIKYLTFSLFIVGLFIQFQIAFGIPILLSVSVFLMFFLLKKKKLSHFFSYFILLIPLVTFILFDIRHDGLQIKTLLHFSDQRAIPSNFLFSFQAYIKDFIWNFSDFLSPGKNLITLGTIIFFTSSFIYCLKFGKKNKKPLILFGYLFLSFVVLSFFYQGNVGNYFWPFLPLVIIIFCSFYTFLKKEVFMITFIILYLINFKTGILGILEFNKDINTRGPHSWAFNLSVAKKIYEEANGDFGYFIYSPDIYAYQQRYAMVYAKKFYPNINSVSSTKKNLTYLIEVDPPKDRPELSSISWRISDIKIERLADKTFRFDFIQIEKYLLSDEEVKVAANPLILDYMFVR